MKGNIHMKKISAILLVSLLCLALSLQAVFAEEIVPALELAFGNAVTRSITAEEAQIEEFLLFKGKSYKPAYTLIGMEGTKPTKVSWTSSDNTVVGMNNGMLSAKKAGTAIVTCTAKLPDGTELQASRQVTVETMVTQLTAKKPTLSVFVGETAEPVAINILPATASCKDLIWSSADESIATVGADGAITGVKAGVVKITATSAELSAAPKKVSVTVTVKQAVTGITLDQSELRLAKAGIGKLVATVTPDDASNKKVTWTSSDKKVATVTPTGQVTAVAPGTAIITATAADGSGQTASCTVEVYAPVATVTMSSPTATVFAGTEGTQLSVKVKPDNAKYYEITWASSNESVATVDQTGKVTPVAGGKATITATVTNPLNPKSAPKKVTCAVTVTQGVDSIKIENGNAIRIGKGKIEKLTATVLPATASNKKITWASADKKVATVTPTGQVTAVGLGTTTITATAADGSGAVSQITVTVYQPVASVTAKSLRAAVTQGKTVNLYATVNPSTAANKNLVWSSDNTGIATVDANGKVTGVSKGQCKITAASAEDAKKKVTFTVTVEPKIPLDATKFTKSGYFGAYYEFAITFKNMTKTRTVDYILFDLKYDYNGKTQTYTSFYDDRHKIGPGASRQIGWWDQFGYKLSYYSNFRIYLKGVRYSDGTYEAFIDNNMIGWFN